LKKQIAGIVPVSGLKSNFNMPWHESLMPIGPNYLAVERAVAECAYAGCNTIWIICNDDVTPLIRYQIGEKIQDPVYNYRHFERNKNDVKRPIRIYYVPIAIRDINKRDNVAWAAIHGSKVADKVLGAMSTYTRPDRFYISWPYGYSAPWLLREHRKTITEGDFTLTYNNENVQDNLYLGFTLTIDQINQLISEVNIKSTGLWKDPETRKEKYSLEERFSYRNFNLKQVFDTIDFSSYNKVEVENYYPIDCWESYCNFLSENDSIRKPSVLVYSEWNELGVDDE
tara:strand:- start:73 stop:924 length:852 start_codon:yes stop_codon:yes gene_type:complete